MFWFVFFSEYVHFLFLFNSSWVIILVGHMCLCLLFPQISRDELKYATDWVFTTELILLDEILFRSILRSRDVKKNIYTTLVNSLLYYFFFGNILLSWNVFVIGMCSHVYLDFKEENIILLIVYRIMYNTLHNHLHFNLNNFV